MEKRWVYWWVGNLFWLIIFVTVAAIIWLREVDGTGATQTTETRLLAFIIWLIAFIIPIIIQVVWRRVNLRRDRHE